LERRPAWRTMVSSSRTLARALANRLVRETLSLDAAVRAGESVLGRRLRWWNTLAGRLVQAWGEGRRLRRRPLEDFLHADAGFRRAWKKYAPSVVVEIGASAVMCPTAGAPSTWHVPAFTTISDLAGWLNLSVSELAWFADLRGREEHLPDGPLRHYHYQWIVKRSGGARLIEAPKQRLKIIQRALLDSILARIPPHEAAHGFRPERSVRTFVALHTGKAVVLKMDLRDFFPSIRRAKVTALWMTAGYPEPVAQCLAGLCTNVVPKDVRAAVPVTISSEERARWNSLWAGPHLPQGAPTSPMLANLAAYRLDARLTGLAQAAGAVYTRYADDLLFSGDEKFVRAAERFVHLVGAVALEEGFVIHLRKTRLMRASVAQRAGGLVLNAKPNVPRREFDRLKAILHRCRSHGPAGENRSEVRDFAAHLAGRIAYVSSIHPARGQKLRDWFDQIDWTEPCRQVGRPAEP